MASTRLTKTFSSSGNRNKWTVSAWVKRTKISSAQTIIACHQNGSYKTRLMFDANDQLYFNDEYNNGTNGRIVSNAKYRDTNGWYNVVAIWDKDNATSADKIRFYVNGERITSFSDTGNAPANASTFNVDGIAHEIGAEASGNYFDGLMSHVHFCDGYAYEPSNFGSTDSTTGQWKINTNPSVSYGTNGFFILKDGNSVTDQSGNSNNWNVTGGTLTNTEDNPSNVFATLSPQLLPRGSGETIKFGNLFFGTSAAIWNTESSTFGIANGKYYFEVKLSDNGSDRRFRWGLQKQSALNGSGDNKVLAGADNDAIGYKTQGESATQGGYFINQNEYNLTDGDINVDGAIYGFAIDLDNQKMYGHMNGTYFHSGNPSAGTGGIDVSSFYTVGEPLFPSFTVHNSNIEINFGNGYFGTTAITSEGTNASGIGKFEYDVPTGYTAICTKGLNE